MMNYKTINTTRAKFADRAVGANADAKVVMLDYGNTSERVLFSTAEQAVLFCERFAEARHSALLHRRKHVVAVRIVRCRKWAVVANYRIDGGCITHLPDHTDALAADARKHFGFAS